ncbi:YraN family protein [uncultured Jannaschia sp.]|uniref:YraN family protein n=1 Tax=uncultured Jannaschia sp. TaxID=293347 RepID=UPI00260DC435|nr:YraN family protein [uncultured Jannaschia sp.]
MSGAVSYHAGLAAEEIVARQYEGEGYRILARRWRGQGGEIDVIAARDAETVFVEVKASVTHAAAAWHLRPRQARRLLDAAAEYMGTLPAGQNSAVRFDVALVDGQGRVEILANAISA